MSANSKSDSLKPRLIGISAAASYIGATEWFVRSLIWDRKVPFCRLGKRLLVDPADLDSFITTQKVGAR